jgi:hypothetical protein
VCIAHLKKKKKPRINEHCHKRCDKTFDLDEKPLKLKLYPPLRNMAKGMFPLKGGNVLDYKARVD